MLNTWITKRSHALASLNRKDLTRTPSLGLSYTYRHPHTHTHIHIFQSDRWQRLDDRRMRLIFISTLPTRSRCSQLSRSPPSHDTSSRKQQSLYLALWRYQEQRSFYGLSKGVRSLVATAFEKGCRSMPLGGLGRVSEVRCEARA
jgi:hypothetical protein